MTDAQVLQPGKIEACAALFFVGYLLCEVPGNLAHSRFGTRVWHRQTRAERNDIARRLNPLVLQWGQSKA